MLFFATTINYVDRQVIALLKDQISVALGWTKDNKEQFYSYVVAAFQAAYGIGYLLGGRLSDVIGIRKGYTISVALWSLFAVATGFAASLISLIFVRAGLGLAEGGNFPTAIKTVSEWFPKKERALATGFFNAGSNLGPILTPAIVPILVKAFGWQSAFYVTGAVGFIWIAWWLTAYKSPQDEPKLSPEEREYIQSDPPDPVERISWMSMLRYKQVWAFIIGMMMSGPVWWFYLFWGPDFFQKQFHLDLKNVGLPLIAIYLVADIGSVGGGWLSSQMIKRGKEPTDARKITLLICAICVTPIFLAGHATSELFAVALFGIAAAAHQGWSANLYTLTSDTMPRSAVSSVVGMGGMASSFVGLFFSLYVGNVLKGTKDFTPILVIPPCSYLLALLFIHILIPKVKSVVF
jgi:ACS family hexuronate transporter-like MFS transporter